MARFNTVQSAMRLSAVFVAAGTILGLASTAAAQSRLEKAERELARAQREVELARRDAEQDGADQSRRKIEATVVVGGDDEDQPREHSKQRIERRIEIQRTGGDGNAERCPLCGGPMGGADGKKVERRIELRGVPGAGGMMELQGLPGLEGMRGLPGGGMFRMFGLGGDGPAHFEAHISGKAIVIGPDGERHEFNFGDDEPAGREPRKEIRRFQIQNEEGDAPRVQRRPEGGDGPGGVSGKIIIIGPDGRRQEFDLGGKDGGDDQGAPRRRVPRIQFEEFDDGQAAPAHPEHEGQRTIEIRRISRGPAV